MDTTLLHIFRNTPFGRETFLQSLYFCKKLNITPVIYIPEQTKFLMYFDNDVVQIDLDPSYLTAPDTTMDHITEITEHAGVQARFFTPKNFTASTLPDVPTNFDFMCCPRSISDLSSKIGLGYLGPRVRRIVKSAKFPILITSPAYKEWKSITVFFGGSVNCAKALKLGIRMARETGMPLEIFTHAEQNRDQNFYENKIADKGLKSEIARYCKTWRFYASGKFEENLFDIPHDTLAIVGACEHSLIKDILFGSTMETIQSTIPNNLLIVGVNYVA